MDQYIKQLLLLHSKIILPEFGAIVIANEDTGELMFNEYLSYDDGKLTALLEEKSNMDLQEAKNTVAKFVRDLKLQLNKGESYSIFQLGEFKKIDDGSITFEGNLKGEIPKEKESGPSPTPVTPTPTPTADPKSSATDIEEERTDKTDKTEFKQKEKEEKFSKPRQEEAKDNSNKRPVEPTPKRTVEPKKNVYVEKKAEDKKEGNPVVEPIKEEKVVIENKEEKKSRKGFLFWFLLMLIILILVGATYVGLNYERVEEYMGWNYTADAEKEEKDKALTNEEQSAEDQQNSEISQIEEPEETTKPEETENIEASNTDSSSDEIIEQETEEKEAVENIEDNNVAPTKVHKPNGTTHHIVIGCFSEKSNADGLVNDFRAKGYDSHIVSQSGGLFFVAAQSYTSFGAAKSDFSEIKGLIDGAWIYRY